MPRTYMRKRPVASYTPEDLRNAVDAIVSHKMTFREAEKHFKIPKAVISNRITGRKTSIACIGQGRKPTLGNHEEGLVKCLLARAEWGYPCDKEELFEVVQQFVQANKLNTPFKDDKPGQDWYLSFMKRHPELSLKKAEQLHQSRAEAADPFVVYKFYEDLKNVMNEHSLSDSPDFLANADETGFQTDPSKLKGIGAKGKPLSRKIQGSGREQISVLACITASGGKLPPFIIYKAEGGVQSRWTSSKEFPGTAYATSKNGWMEEPQFYEWAVKVFIPHFQLLRQRQNCMKMVLLILDGHKSHISYRIIKVFMDADVVAYRLPSHLTHRLQPLDVSVFGPLKIKWDKMLVIQGRQILGTGRCVKMTKEIFSEKLGEAWMNHLKVENCKSGFEKAGIYPHDPEKFPKTDFDQTKLMRYLQSREAVKERPKSSQVEMNEDRIPEASLNLQSVPSTSSLNLQSVPSTSSLNLQSVPSTSMDIVRSSLSDSCDSERSIIDIFLQNMKKSNADTPQEQKKQIRRKKLQYGEVLTTEEILLKEKELEEERLSKKKRNRDRPKHENKKYMPMKKNKKKRYTRIKQESNESSSESEISVEFADSSDGDLGTCIEKEPDDDDDFEIRIGDFVLVKFATKKKIYHYVGLVTEEDPIGEFKVKYMRKEGNRFRWPEKEDISTVTPEDIIRTLPQPVMDRREHVSFPVKFDGYVNVL